MNAQEKLKQLQNNQEISTTKKILVVEDDLSLGFLLMEYLESEGYAVKLCKDGTSGWEHYRKGKYDLCIMDVMMPGMDGFTLAEKIHAADETMPFLFLTARSMKEDVLRGYAVGAEDYMTKPFCEEELLCKIGVILRRQPLAEPSPKTLPTTFQIGDFYFDYNQQQLTFQGENIRITVKENEVLRLLCLHQNQILKREEAVEQIYGKRDYFLGRSFDVFISRLRKLLSKDPRIKIENVFKVGFILNVQDK